MEIKADAKAWKDCPGQIRPECNPHSPTACAGTREEDLQADGGGARRSQQQKLPCELAASVTANHAWRPRSPRPEAHKLGPSHVLPMAEQQ